MEFRLVNPLLAKTGSFYSMKTGEIGAVYYLPISGTEPEKNTKKFPILHISDIRRPGSGVILSENGMKGVCSMLKRLLNLFRKPKTVQKEISRRPERWVQLTLPLE